MPLTTAQRRDLLGFDDRWLMLVGIPTIALVAAMLYALYEGNGEPGATLIAQCFGIGLVFTSVYWGLIRTAIIRLRCVPALRERTAARLLSMAAITIVVVLVGKFSVQTFIINPFVLTPEQQAVEPPLSYDILISLVLCVMTVAIYESLWYFAKFRDAALAQEQLAKSQMQSQLVSLRDQVNPHFLFNSLNTLASIIPEDPATATRFVQRLSAVYRRILEHGGAETVALSDELAALDDYLFLMRTRFEDKLDVALDIDPAARHQHVVPLSLQMLVENAIKHNIVSRERPLRITIFASPTAVEVVNTLQLRAIKEHSTGIGLHNIRERYRLLDGGTVDIRETHDEYRVSLPLLPAQTDARVPV